jgi:uncharacterized RDD family membrane protein YckC
MSDRAHDGPIDRLMGAVPVNAIIRQVDVQAIIERVDLNAVLDRVDMDRLLARIDVNELLTRLDLGEIIAESTKGVAARALDSLRVATAHLDLALERMVDRVLRRTDRDAAAAQPESARFGKPPSSELQGRNAGAVSRFTAAFLDLAISLIALSVLIAAVVVVFDVIVGSTVTLHVPAVVGTPLASLWLFTYLLVSWAVPGRTPAMGVFGLRVVRGDGTHVGWGHALLRLLIFPFSLIAVIGLLGIVIGRNHRALYDVIGDTRVVFDW